MTLGTRHRLACVLLLLATLSACGFLNRSDRAGRDASRQVGVASWYDPGRRTVQGVAYDSADLTAAHRTLPFGTRVRVTNLANGRQATVTINDRGPFVLGRVIDVSVPAARRLGIVRSGVTRVRVEVVRRAPLPQA